MNGGQFVATNSVTWRLKSVMMLIAVFFILSALGIYFSSLSFLDGLQDINSANQVLNLTNQSLEGLDSSTQNLNKLQGPKNLKDVEFSFHENQRILKMAIEKSISLSKNNPDVENLLKKGMTAVNVYEKSVDQLFTSLPANNEDMRSEILITLQFATDAKELLRKAQINLRNDTDRNFSSIYANRFRPLLVAISLSAVFFLFVITFGFNISNKIAASLRNLRGATDKVSEGNLSYQAPIIENDEFGLLTNTFNEMVLSLREGRATLDSTIERIQALQQITASFSEALTSDEVIEVTAKEGFHAVGASAGGFALITSEGDELETRKFIGYEVETMSHWQSFPISLSTPFSDSVRNRKPIFMNTLDQISETYPHMHFEIKSHGHQAMASVPLMIGEVCLGGLLFCFNHARNFSQSEKDFIIAIARQCAQALHRAKLYDDARTAIQARDEFLSIASHELKTPLTPLKLQLQILAKQYKKGQTDIPPEKFLKIMENSDNQLNRLSRLIEDLLDVSRITAGKLRLNLESIDLKKIIEEVMAQYEHQLKDALLRIEIDAESKVICQVDPMRIEQVIINLLTNALKYAPGKPIKISLKKAGEIAKICIKDQGPGIAPENQERIFKRFERVKATDNVGGLGLGLYISHQIIEAHHGKIYVESTPGNGSNFVIELPVVS